MGDDINQARIHIVQASNNGDINLLYQSLTLHPEMLDEMDKKKIVNTPLHEAAKMGHAKFCAEMMNLMPSFGKKLNPEGLSPLHLALHHQCDSTVQALVNIDEELIRVKGRDGITPLMYCAQRAGTYNDTLATFLRDCPQAIFDLSTSSETALHVALRSGNCDGAEMILKWLQRSSSEKILLWKDDEGNTPLHLAVEYKCEKVVEMLLESSRLNKRNKKFQTPLDIAHQVGVPEIINLLNRKKAKLSNQLEPKSSYSYSKFLLSSRSCWEKAIQHYTHWVKDLDADMRNVVLVVAVLIAAATYTAMLQPPGGIYQASANNTTTTTNRASSSVVEPKSNAGKMVMNHANYQRFMPTNTLAFTLAIVVIIFVLPARPYTVALLLSLLSLSYSCLIAMTFVSEEGRTADVSFFLAWSLLALAVVVKLSYFLLKGLLWEKTWWAPNFFVQARNLVERCPPDYGPQKRMLLMSTLRKQYKLTINSLNEKP